MSPSSVGNVMMLHVNNTGYAFFTFLLEKKKKKPPILGPSVGYCLELQELSFLDIHLLIPCVFCECGDDLSKTRSTAAFDTCRPDAHTRVPDKQVTGTMKQRNCGRHMIEPPPFGEADQSQTDRGLQDYAVWQSHCIPQEPRGLRPDGIMCLTPWPRLWNATNTFSDWLQAKSSLLICSCTREYAFHRLVLNHQSRWILEQWLVCSGTPHISSIFIRQE